MSCRVVFLVVVGEDHNQLDRPDAAQQFIAGGFSDVSKFPDWRLKGDLFASLIVKGRRTYALRAVRQIVYDPSVVLIIEAFGFPSPVRNAVEAMGAGVGLAAENPAGLREQVVSGCYGFRAVKVNVGYFTRCGAEDKSKVAGVLYQLGKVVVGGGPLLPTRQCWSLTALGQGDDGKAGVVEKCEKSVFVVVVIIS